MPRWHKAKITIESLTPHFYPQVFLKKISLDDQPDQLAEMDFPSLNNFDFAFGEDPFPQLHSNTFEYEWNNKSDRLYTYYTVAIYQNNWQLSNYRKAEYQIKVEADVIECENAECSELEIESTPVGSSNILKLER